jgi:hypothetical protein
MSIAPSDYVGAETILAIDRVLWSTLSATLLVAIFALAIFEFVRPIIRSWLQLWVVRDWLPKQPSENEQRESKPHKLPEWLTRAFPEIKKGLTTNNRLDVWDTVTGGSFLTNELFFGKVRAAAQSVLENPANAASDFYFLASYANEEDSASVVALDWLARNDPEALKKHLDSKDSNPANKPERQDGNVADTAAAAQDSVGRSIERKLEELRLRLATLWSMTTRAAVPILGIVVAYAAAGSGGAKSLGQVAIVGLLGGLVASWLQALLALIFPRQPD